MFECTAVLYLQELRTEDLVLLAGDVVAVGYFIIASLHNNNNKPSPITIQTL
jgi:hypothetical protein